MKALFQLLLALTAAMVFAAPVQHIQNAMADKYEHSVDDAYTHRTNFAAPYVLKGPGHASLKPASPSAKAAAAKGSPRPSSWLSKGVKWWTGGLAIEKFKFDVPKMRAPSCFCSGGSVCCNTLKGIDCGYGTCAV